MSMNRKTIEEAAVAYGGELVKKLDESDWIVLGTKPGPKKLEEINEKNLKTMTEQQFLEMLKGGGESQEPPKKKLKT
jgi:BRCT domain type II-containing protein